MQGHRLIVIVGNDEESMGHSVASAKCLAGKFILKWQEEPGKWPRILDLGALPGATATPALALASESGGQRKQGTA